MSTLLEFEESILELEGKIRELRHLSDMGDVNIVEEITRLQAKVEKELHRVYDKLTPWQKVQVARHHNRPKFSHISAALFEDFTPLAGDRCFGDDQSILGGFARFRGQSVMVLGQEKGTSTEGRIKHNFGMPHPEGYRKACRLMDLADRFQVPVLCFVDTPGAYPGMHAESRGQAEAIARSTESGLKLTVPSVAVITGEGGSGGAVALASTNAVLMFEHSIYSVISPEGCAGILWRSGAEAPKAAEALKLTAQDLKTLKVIDAIIAEPLGGAHRNPNQALENLGDAVEKALLPLLKMSPSEIKAHRHKRFLDIGRTL